MVWYIQSSWGLGSEISWLKSWSSKRRPSWWAGHHADLGFGSTDPPVADLDRKFLALPFGNMSKMQIRTLSALGQMGLVFTTCDPSYKASTKEWTERVSVNSPRNKFHGVHFWKYKNSPYLFWILSGSYIAYDRVMSYMLFHATWLCDYWYHIPFIWHTTVPILLKIDITKIKYHL